MKFGQALSVFESALPEEVAGPLPGGADEAPGGRARRCRRARCTRCWRSGSARTGGSCSWSSRTSRAAAASIGQVHRAVWHDGREVAVKVQYPGAGEALLSDLTQLSRFARLLGPLIPGMDIKPLIAELRDRVSEELDYELEAAGPAGARRGVRRRPGCRGAGRGAPVRPGAGDRVDRRDPAVGGDRRRHPGAARPRRPAAGPLPLLRPRPHRAAARRPAPGQLPAAAGRRTARAGGWACWTSARSTGCPAGCRSRSATRCG